MLFVLAATFVGCNRDASPRGEPTTASGPHATAPEPPTARQTASAAENALAESMLLVLDDFPGGWVHKAGDPSEDTPTTVPPALARCVSAAYVGRTGRAVGGEFSNKDTTLLSVNPIVSVFDNEDDAQIAARAIISEAQCFADVVGDGLDVDTSFAFGPTHTEPLSAGLFDRLTLRSTKPRHRRVATCSYSTS
jgi:hypothetical protein